MQSDQATVVGESIVITGNLSGDEDLIILGRVEGTISLSRTLFVSTDGVVKADVAVQNAVISGVVVGNVSASDSIQITETGRVVGDVVAPRVMITTGARVRGQVTAGEADAVSQESPSQTSQNARGSINHMYERMGLPARRPMAQPPVAAKAASASPSAPASGANAQSMPNTNDGAAGSRRPQSGPMNKKKTNQAARRRD